jgi:hypothetical protein
MIPTLQHGISFHNSAQKINNDKANDGVLLMISSVSCKGHSLTTIWDPGANMSLITHKAHIFDIHYLIYHKAYACCIVLINVLSLNN